MGHMILCIDDEPTGLQIRKLLLESQGYSVMIATSGRQGLELFAAHAFDAVVLDFYMPEMDGGQVAVELKRRNPNIPILLLSAYLDLPDDIADHVDAQALKGESPTNFLEVLQQLLAAGKAKAAGAGSSQ